MSRGDSVSRGSWNQWTMSITAEYRDGAWVFSGTGIPLFALCGNLASGATVEQFAEWFPGVEERQVRAVLEHDANTSRTAVIR